MILFQILTVGLQINSMFPLHDVMHIVAKRTVPLRTEYGDFDGYDGMVLSAKIPTHAIVSLVSDRIHFFLHDEKRVCRCMWDGSITFDDKKDVVMDMMKWWTNKSNRLLLDHRLINYEDGCVFTEVIEELNQ